MKRTPLHLRNQLRRQRRNARRREAEVVTERLLRSPKAQLSVFENAFIDWITGEKALILGGLSLFVALHMVSGGNSP